MSQKLQNGWNVKYSGRSVPQIINFLNGGGQITVSPTLPGYTPHSQPFQFG